MYMDQLQLHCGCLCFVDDILPVSNKSSPRCVGLHQPRQRDDQQTICDQYGDGSKPVIW